MASLSDVPSGGLRELARQVPDDIRHRIGPVELGMRVAYSRDLADAGKRTGDPELAARMLVASHRALVAMPHMDHAAERDRLTELKNQAGQQFDWDLQVHYGKKLDQLDSDHPQAPGLASALTRAHEYTEPMDPEKRAMLAKRQARQALRDRVYKVAADEVARIMTEKGTTR